METFVSLIIIVFGILQIILFFKMWEMTNNVKKLVKHFCDKKENPTPKPLSKEEREKAEKYTLGHMR
ncbi:MAG: hypothetical protein ACTTI1_01045 [Prevotella intermedia]